MKRMKINGLPVKNGKKSILLHITDSDVKKGKVKNPMGCAAAIACTRSLGASEARVHVGRTYLRYNGHWERYMTSDALRSEIVSFDRGGKFEPGDYMLLKLQPSYANRSKQGAYKKKPKKETKKRAKYHTLTNIRPMGLSA